MTKLFLASSPYGYESSLRAFDDKKTMLKTLTKEMNERLKKDKKSAIFKVSKQTIAGRDYYDCTAFTKTTRGVERVYGEYRSIKTREVDYGKSKKPRYVYITFAWSDFYKEDCFVSKQKLLDYLNKVVKSNYKEATTTKLVVNDKTKTKTSYDYTFEVKSSNSNAPLHRWDVFIMRRKIERA